jgi:hypothetical protein
VVVDVAEQGDHKRVEADRVGREMEDRTEQMELARNVGKAVAAAVLGRADRENWIVVGWARGLGSVGRSGGSEHREEEAVEPPIQNEFTPFFEKGISD